MTTNFSFKVRFYFIQQKLNQTILHDIENAQICHVFYATFEINYSVDQVNDGERKNKN
jgi:hypothetical protein